MTNFFELCRQNTGKSMCDSGDYYGRHYEQPPIPEDAPMIREWDKGCSATIETAVYLNEAYRIDPDWQEGWQSWAEIHGDDMSWFESAQAFMEQAGYVCEVRINTYNGESDLSQVFEAHVWRKPDQSQRDWIYDTDAVIVIFVHTGCDVRGGYTSPVFCQSNTENTVPVDVSAGYRIEEARNYRRAKYQQPWEEMLPALKDPGADFVSGTELLDHNECRTFDETWQPGYSSYPYGEMEKAVERWFEFTRTRNTVCVKLKDGLIAKVYAEGPYLG